MKSIRKGERDVANLNPCSNKEARKSMVHGLQIPFSLSQFTLNTKEAQLSVRISAL